MTRMDSDEENKNQTTELDTNAASDRGKEANEEHMLFI